TLFEVCHRRNISGKSPFKTALFVSRYVLPEQQVSKFQEKHSLDFSGARIVGALQEGHNNNKEERVELLQL
ncbi:hypothetical protein D5086_003745, partial [Populus alba]